MSQPIELIVLSIKERAARCRPPGTDWLISLRASGLWKLVPGEITVVNPRGSMHPPSASSALGLIPLALKGKGDWDPSKEYWGEEDESVDAWAGLIYSNG